MIAIKIIEHTLEDKVTPVETYSVRRRKGAFKYIWRLGYASDAYTVELNGTEKVSYKELGI